MFALTRVPFIEALVIKCKTLHGTTAERCAPPPNKRAAAWRAGAGRASQPLRLLRRLLLFVPVRAGDVRATGIGTEQEAQTGGLPTHARGEK